jgi:hypothetical protein
MLTFARAPIEPRKYAVSRKKPALDRREESMGKAESAKRFKGSSCEK